MIEECCALSGTMIKLILAFAIVIVISQILVRFARSIRATVADVNGGKQVHVETPIAVFDLQPRDKLDPALAAMLIYPGATRMESQPPEYEADIHALGREYRILAAVYWTPTPADIVWEFYKRELPGWQERGQTGGGGSLTHKGEDGVRTLRVYRQNDRTLIETRISFNQKSDTLSASASSGPGFGTLR